MFFELESISQYLNVRAVSSADSYHVILLSTNQLIAVLAGFEAFRL